MKKQLILLLGLFSLNVNAQNAFLEYWIDVDPGYGLANELATTDLATFEDGILTPIITSSTIALGVHTLGVRLRVNNEWSLTNTWYFSVVEAPEQNDVTTLEWSWVADEGFGNSMNSIEFDPSSTEVTQEIEIPIPSDVMTGENTLFTRVQDSEGNWSHTQVFISDCEEQTQLEIFPISETTLEIDTVGCSEFTSPNGTTISESGTIEEIYFNEGFQEYENYIYNVIIQDVNTDVIVENGTAMAEAETASFQWLDCNANLMPISGETDAEFTPTSDGLYSVEVTQSGCSSISDCVSVIVVSVKDFLDNSNPKFNVYPNPSSQRLIIEAKGTALPQNAKLFDSTGRIVEQLQLTAPKTQLSVSHLPRGLYILNIDGISISISISN